jgi:hypothetical protein
MATQTELDFEFAEHCRWEAERTLDAEVAHSLRTLAERYRRRAGRSPQSARPSVRAEPHYHRC